MNKLLVPIILVVLAFAGAGYYFLNNQQKVMPTPLPQGGVCDQETITCSDGTVLHKSGPNCDFPPCPSGNESSPVSTYVPSSTPAASVQGEDITIKGEVICLPHRNANGPQTMECAFGLKGDDGNNYGLSDLGYRYMMSMQTGKKAQIKGKLMKSQDQKYNSIGTISIESISYLN